MNLTALSSRARNHQAADVASVETSGDLGISTEEVEVRSLPLHSRLALVADTAVLSF